MKTNSDLSFPSHANVFDRGLSLEAVRERAPAVFAVSAHERLSQKYCFVPTARVLNGLMEAGFIPVDARQTHARRASPMHARHVVRLRRRVETVELKGASVPEVVFLNSHDGTSRYELRLGLFRLVCSNGLIVSRGAFPAYCVAHRGNVVDEIVASALRVSEQFERLAAQVERMEARQLSRDEQVRFADRALALRYPDPGQSGISASQLLIVRRPEDLANDLYTITNRVQEHLCRGGASRRTANGRLMRMRRISSIKREIDLNGRLWELATEVLAA
jgi:hypothetical protein